MNNFTYTNSNKRYHTLDYYYKQKFNSKVFKISNGNLLAVGSYNGVDYLYYIDILTKTDKLLYQTREGILDIEEEGGVCIIYLDDIFDLEYNFETDTMSLIYIAESK